MSRFKVALIFITIACLLAPLPTYAQEGGNQDETTPDRPQVVEYIVISEGNVNLRAGPGTSFEIVGGVVPGESIMVYDEEPEVAGWLRLYRPELDDAYIANFLVERAPMRFYPIDQEPLLEASGRGASITEVYEIPQGAYRIDATVEDRSFILKSVVVEGDCRDQSIFNELDFDARRLRISGLFISRGCSIIFETDNVSGPWEFALRDILDVDTLIDSVLEIEAGTTISASGRALTMPTMLPSGIWTIAATVQDNSFILRAQVLSGDCDDGSVFNELDFDADVLEVSRVYRSGEDGCIIFWETENVKGSWELEFDSIR